MDWQPISSAPLGVVVETKIDDGRGERNHARLKGYKRAENTRTLWFLEDGGMYVYYTPTHWRPAERVEVGRE